MCRKPSAQGPSLIAAALRGRVARVAAAAVAAEQPELVGEGIAVVPGYGLSFEELLQSLGMPTAPNRTQAPLRASSAGLPGHRGVAKIPAGANV